MTFLETIFRDNYRKMIYFAQKYVPEDECHDIVVEVIIMAAKKKGFDKLQTKKYVYDGVYMRCVDWIRSDKRHRNSYKELAYLNPDIDYISMKIQTDYVEAVYNEIKKLPKQCGKIMQLYFKGLETAQIAREMSLTARTVLNQKTRAISLIRAAIGQ